MWRVFVLFIGLLQHRFVGKSAIVSLPTDASSFECISELSEKSLREAKVTTLGS